MKIIHLSDLHFGTEEPSIVDGLLEAIATLAADLTIISGDFTQVGSDEEFATARRFMNALEMPVLCIPGNHDIPRYDIKQRLFNPLQRYKEFITDDLCPILETPEALIAGVNTARAFLPHWNWANGAVSHAQRQKLRTIFDPAEEKWTICTMHHPIHKVEDMPLDVTVFGRKRTVQTIHECKIDIVLTGHVHHASLKTIGDDLHKTVYVSASTALSSRTRHQENGFNCIELNGNDMIVHMYKFSSTRFSLSEEYFQTRA